METLTDKNISGKVLDHLGLVASTIDKLGIVGKIDAMLPISTNKGAKATMGQRVAAMLLNGLGFMDTRLYMFPEFLQNKPVDRLIGESVKAEDFNDDALGRCLDAIYEYGVNNFFSELAFPIGLEHGLLGKNANIDTSSLSLHGDYSKQDVINEAITQEETKESLKTPKITYGFSKDHRPDLKQIVINLATTGAAGFPIWMESHSGNASDKKILHEAAERMQKFCSTLKQSPSFMYVADSAMYSSCVNKSSELTWLSRVPEQSNISKDLLRQKDSNFCWTEIGKGYRICVVENKYKDVHQRWCIIFSEQAYKRETETLKRKVAKEKKVANNNLSKLGHQKFACEKDAKIVAKQFEKTLKYHAVKTTVEQIRKHITKGRPKKGVKGKVIGYKIVGEVANDFEKIEVADRPKGRFIIATNELDQKVLPDVKMLEEYKEQSKTESGFKFIKDDAFEVSSVFLKKPSRISSLLVIMTLCLMIYSVAQYHLRQSLKKKDEFVPDQTGKDTKAPTLKRVFKLFNGVQVLTIKIGDTTQELVINLTAKLKQIVRHFGKKAIEIYNLNEGGSGDIAKC
jgi:transposase